MGSLEGTTALITGGSRGIGRAICVKLAAEGVRIILHYHRNEAAAREAAAAAGGDVKLVRANLASSDEIRAMFEEIGSAVKVDFLINNAGVWKPSPLGSTTEERMDEIIDTNLKGPFLVTQNALPLLKDGARIINISSVAGRIGVAGGRSLYGATKAAIDSFTSNWALELAPRKILVNAVAPGYITTDMTAAHLDDPATLERAMVRHPLGRLGAADDVADVVLFLCSEQARFITGQSINVSGGFVV